MAERLIALKLPFSAVLTTDRPWFFSLGGQAHEDATDCVEGWGDVERHRGRKRQCHLWEYRLHHCALTPHGEDTPIPILGARDVRYPTVPCSRA